MINLFFAFILLISSTPALADFIYAIYPLKVERSCTSFDSPHANDHEYLFSFNTYVCFNNRFTHESHLGHLPHYFSRHFFRIGADQTCEMARKREEKKLVSVKFTPCDHLKKP